MWKKSKRILLCILALMLLLSMAKSEQLFVQADMESTEKVQTKEDKKNLEATTQKEKDASKNDEAKEETEEKTEEYKREEENTERKTDENKAAEEVSAE